MLYGVVPPLFGDRPLDAVTARLDELAAQGVDAVWLSPIQATDDESQISYALTDWRTIRPDFGTDADLRELVDEAHRLGMKVILDVVPNHVSAGHPYFVDARRRQTASPFFRLFERDASGRPTHYFDWEHLPNLDYDAPEVRAMAIEAFAHWIRSFDVDGFRVDAAWGVQQRRPDFWPHLTRMLRAMKPDIFLLAEASARDAYWADAGFDAAYDWTDQLGEWAWQRAFDDLEQIGPHLRTALLDTGVPMHRVARFLNNNDTGDRFVTRYGPATTRVAATLLHTLPGIPIVYAGDDVGAAFRPYDDPPPIEWKDRHGLRAHYANLAEIREALPSLRSGRFIPLDASRGSVVAFIRDDGDDVALVVLEFGRGGPVELELPARYANALPPFLTDALTGRTIALEPCGSTVRVPIDRSQGLVLTAQPASPLPAGAPAAARRR